MKRPLQPGEAVGLSVALHAVVLLLLSVHLMQAAAVAPAPPPPKPVAFRFVNLPDRPPPETPPREDAPVSDRDREASGGERNPDTPTSRQPRLEGDTAQLTLPERPRRAPTPLPPRPEPIRPPARPEKPEIQKPGPAPQEEPERPSVEDKRAKVQEFLRDLETGNLFEPGFDNPEGDFFEPASTGDISFETQGVDWGPYAARLHRIVKRNWIVPPAAQIGTKGVVRLRFRIGRDGSIQDLEIVDDSGTVPLDDAAWAAIHNSHPLPPPPLPEDWHKDDVGVTWTFYYNTRPR